MMNELKGLGGMSFDQMIHEIAKEGEYYTAYVTVYIGSYSGGREKYSAQATSRNQFKALGYAIEEIGRQVRVLTRGAP